MKKIRCVFAMILALSMFALCACGGSGTENKTTEAQETTVATEAEQTTEAATEADYYKVKVVDESGTPIVGALVQMCLDSCFPAATNENGVAQFALEEADYKVTFLSLPEGYAYSGEETEFHFESGSKEMTIILKKAQ